jgi:choline-glycine betaine transporter
VNAVEAKAYLTNLRTATSFKFTWLLQITKPIYFCFMLYVAWKYGHVHLGNKDDKPEFSSLTYAIIIITAGISNGVLVYSVAEPLSHQHYHFFANAGYRSQDEVDMFAVNMTVTDWGFAGWAPYTVVAVAMSLATYRCGLPLIVRSCFYPILGHYTWGWIGDVIDGFVIVVTLFGTFTHLGFAALNVTSGFHFMGWVNDNASNEHTIAVQNSMVWIITIVSVFSVLSGLHGAYKILCLLAMATVVALTAIVFFLDDTKFLLNLQVQEIGYYLQYSLLQLNFWTDAFGQLPEGGGRAIDGKAAESWWMASWFNFFQAWW